MKTYGYPDPPLKDAVTLFDFPTQPYTAALNTNDMLEFSEAALRVYQLMKDGRYYTATEIIAASGQREGLRRMRQLRKCFNIETARASSSSREFVYRLTAKGI